MDNGQTSYDHKTAKFIMKSSMNSKSTDGQCTPGLVGRDDDGRRRALRRDGASSHIESSELKQISARVSHIAILIL